MPKPITQENLARDLSYIRDGVASMFFHFCPPRPGLRVLEVAAASSKFSISYAAAGCHVTAIDIDPHALAYGRALYEEAKRAIEIKGSLEFICGNVHRLASRYKQPEFDYTISEGLSHHWSDWRRQSSISQQVYVLKTGGSLLMYVSNAHCPDMMRYAREVKHTYVNMPETQKPFTIGELEHRLRRAGLSQVQVGTPMPNLEESRLVYGYGVKL